ncbi:MAG: phosphoribosylaminoimidazolesuccinocarboxamide synthase [Vicinamibacteria bacterium]|nr:phosphoribosylaminoimidazolesuccinocarboxamide synthase [Vicinamibacteria bacterium]
MREALTATSLDLPLLRRGKVRDVYDLGTELLIVTTDRLSAFDVVLPQGIPDKGRVLNQLSLFWFKRLESSIPNHIVAAEVADFPASLQPHRELLEGRSMVVRKTDPLPVECVVRGYLSGSGLKDYRRTGAICGLSLPAGLVESQKFPFPLFTPATKAETGHDENISFDQMVKLVGFEHAETARGASLTIYEKARRHAESVGLTIADTKFEFGIVKGGLIWIDEALTPDSSRFWESSMVEPGRTPPSFDKQFVRDWLETLTWNKTYPGPDLPADVIAGTRSRYLEAFRRLTGRELAGI